MELEGTLRVQVAQVVEAAAAYCGIVRKRQLSLEQLLPPAAPRVLEVVARVVRLLGLLGKLSR